MIHIRTGSFIILFLLSSGCSDKSITPAPIQENPASIPSPVDDGIREAIFRYQIKSIVSSIEDQSVIVLANVEVDSLGYMRRYIDPSDELVNRIKVDNPKVKKYSQCHYNGRYYYDSDSTRGGILFNVYPLQYLTSSGIKVEGGYYEGNLAAAGYDYFLHKAAGIWIVDSLRMKWIS